MYIVLHLHRVGGAGDGHVQQDAEREQDLDEGRHDGVVLRRRRRQVVQQIDAVDLVEQTNQRKRSVYK